MTEEIDCQMFEKCVGCHLRPVTQYCNCESPLLLCLFCARNHWKKIKDLEIKNHMFGREDQGSQEMPICPFEEKRILGFINITQIAMKNIESIQTSLKRKHHKWSEHLPYNNNCYACEEKNHHYQKLKEYEYWINETKEIINFQIENQIGCYSLHKKLTKILDTLSRISLIIDYGNEENQAEKTNSNPTNNTIEAIHVFLGDYSNISSISNWFGVLTMEDALSVLRTFLIMNYAFSNSFIYPILEFLMKTCENKINERSQREINRYQWEFFRKMYQKLREKTDHITNEVLKPMLEELKSDEDKAIIVVSAELLIKNTQFDGYLEALTFNLQYWKIDNSLLVVYILMLQASAYKKNNNFLRAEELLNHALHELYETTGGHHPLASECMIWLAESYLNDPNKLQYSLKLFEKALDLRMKTPDWYEREHMMHIITRIQDLRNYLFPS